MSFEERVAEIRDWAHDQDDVIAQSQTTSPSWDDDMFKNGWPNCWGDFNNVSI